MEIKLNHYTFPVLCGVVSSITYAILYFTSNTSKKTKHASSSQSIDTDESNDDDEDTEYLNKKSKLRKDSVYLAKNKRKASNEDTIHSNGVLNVNQMFDTDDVESDSSAIGYEIESLKTKRDSLHLTKLQRHPLCEKTSHGHNILNEDNSILNVAQGTTKYSNHDELDEFEISDPAQLLQQRIERSKRNKKGAGGRRATIAFADELQATLAEHLKSHEATEDKHEENSLLSPYINSSDVKPILKPHTNGETGSMFVDKL